MVKRTGQDSPVGPGKSGHTLYLLISRVQDDNMGGVNVFDYSPSDYHSISLHIETRKPPTIEKEIV